MHKLGPRHYKKLNDIDGDIAVADYIKQKTGIKIFLEN